MAVRIIAIRKDHGNHYNPHEAISHYKWLNEQTNETGIISRADMVAWVERERNNQAYVRDNLGTVNCYVNVSRSGTKFLQTYADRRWTDNLLNLTEC